MQENEKTLPVGYYEKDNHIYGPKGFQTNGTITVDDYYLKKYPNCSVEGFVTLTFHIGKAPNIKQRTATIPISALNPTKLLKYIPDEFIMLASNTQKQRFLTNLINSYIFDRTPTELYVLDQGFNQVSGRMIYAMGDTVINADSPNYISHIPYKIKPHSDNKDYFKWLMRFSKMGDIFPVLLLAAIVPYIKPLLKESDIQGNTDFSVYICGETGSGKTSVAKLLTSIFVGDKNTTSLSSEKEAIHKLSELKDTCVLIDDLHKTDSSRLKSSIEAKLSDILHQKNSAGEIKYKSKNAKIDSMIFITAEYPPKNHSTINRCLVAEMPEIDMNALNYLQETQDLYVEFIMDFIKWICKNFNDLIFKVKYYKEICKPNKAVNSKLYSGAKRVARMELILNITMNLFLEFISGGDKIMDLNLKKFSYFQNSINHCISDTLDLTKKESDEFKRDYIDVIIEALVYNRKDCVAKSYKVYKKGKRKSDDIETDYYCPKLFFLDEGRDEDFYCITGRDLVWLFERQEHFEYKYSIKSISKQLHHYGLLKVNGGELSYPRRVTDSSKKVKTRYYHIRISVLKELLSPEQREYAIACSSMYDNYF